MTRSLKEIQADIDRLQVEASKVREQEITEVVSRIKDAIATYDIKPEMLYGSSLRASKAGRKSSSAAAKYQDSKGNTWVGRGPRPRWLNDALKSGASLEDFLIGGSGERRTASAPAAVDGVVAATPAPAAPAKKRVSAKQVKPMTGGYRDGDKSWTGRGPKPKWIKDALAAGKTLKEMRI